MSPTLGCGSGCRGQVQVNMPLPINTAQFENNGPTPLEPWKSGLGKGLHVMS